MDIALRGEAGRYPRCGVQQASGHFIYSHQCHLTPTITPSPRRCRNSGDIFLWCGSSANSMVSLPPRLLSNDRYFFCNRWPTLFVMTYCGASCTVFVACQREEIAAVQLMALFSASPRPGGSARNVRYVYPSHEMSLRFVATGLPTVLHLADFVI